MARGSEGPTLEAALHRAHVSPHAGSAEVPARNGYKTYIVTGGGQDFVRVYAERVYGSRPSRWSAAQAARVTATTRTASPS